jgi:hypothetical protein
MPARLFYGSHGGFDAAECRPGHLGTTQYEAPDGDAVGTHYSTAWPRRP